jgi:hypothetical protein
MVLFGIPATVQDNIHAGCIGFIEDFKIFNRAGKTGKKLKKNWKEKVNESGKKKYNEDWDESEEQE